MAELPDGLGERVRALREARGWSQGQLLVEVRRFLPPDNLPVQQLHDDPDVFVLAGRLPLDEADEDVVWNVALSSWRYVSSAPTHNPGRFDLWVEVVAGRQKLTLGNWRGAE